MFLNWTALNDVVSLRSKDGAEVEFRDLIQGLDNEIFYMLQPLGRMFLF